MATETAPRVPEAERGSRKRTIPALWRDAIRQAADRPRPAYLVETERGWEPLSWQEAGRRVEDLAHGLLSLGVRKGDAVAIVGWTRLEWVLLDLALAHTGGVTAPIYPNSSPNDCAYAIDHAEAVIVFVEDDAQREKIDEVRERLPRVREVISFDALDALAARGREYAREHPGALDEAVAAIDEEDLYTFIYTSGTTGPPKACMIRHRNYYEMVAIVDRLEDFIRPDEVMLLFLPLAHNFGRLMSLAGPYVGFTLALLPDLEAGRIRSAIADVRPTIVPSAPRIFEKMYARIKAQLDAATGPKRRLIDWALGVGRRASPYKQRGEPLPPTLAIQHRIADRLVYRKVRQSLGGRFRTGISGAAPLSQEVGEFFHALDILILEGYGLTECTTACAVNRRGKVRFGTVGPPLPGFEVRIAGDGEIMIRSETVFAGYYKNDEATREVLEPDGWLHSGDIGELDADGFLRITDRKKDLIVTAGGKNVAPANLENALKLAPLVSQALVIGDRRPYVTALITLDPERAAGKAPDELERAVQQAVDAVNRELSRFEQIKKFAILPREFSEHDGEVTPTLKLKRKVIEEHFAAEIERLYR